MATYTRGQGMETYGRILEDARSNNKPVGPEHHRFDQQLREWVAKNPEVAVKVEQTVRKQTSERPKSQTKSVQKNDSPTSLRDRMNNLNRKLSAEQDLQSKYKAAQRKKIADGYKTPEWQRSTDLIKSRGNGL